MEKDPVLGTIFSDYVGWRTTIRPRIMPKISEGDHVEVDLCGTSHIAQVIDVPKDPMGVPIGTFTIYIDAGVRDAT